MITCHGRELTGSVGGAGRGVTSAADKPCRLHARASAGGAEGEDCTVALEASILDSGRLSRGRTYARKSMVGPVTVTPDVLRAEIEGSAPWRYDAAVHLRVLTDAQ
jgi:hypothetical protein